MGNRMRTRARMRIKMRRTSSSRVLEELLRLEEGRFLRVLRIECGRGGDEDVDAVILAERIDGPETPGEGR